MMTNSLQTPLYSEHIKAEGKMVPFAGYDLPVQYKGGVIKECLAVRNGVGLFDVSHMARLTLRGDKVIEFLEWVTTNDIGKLADNQGQYSLLPNETGGIVDDIIVYRIKETEFRMVVNASNHEKDVAWLNKQNTFGVNISDHTSETAMIVVQGPKAGALVAELSGQKAILEDIPFFGVFEGEIAGVQCFAARSGYTGEDGFELICAADDAVSLWQSLVGAGAEPCGLGSRDALRVEAGLPLYGHELNDELSPLVAGLGWVISKTKSFIGSEHIHAIQEKGASQRVVGVKLETKRLPQIGMDVLVNGDVVGQVCSGVYSPLLECGIAFARVKSDVLLKTQCELDMRGKAESATIVNKRFFKRNS